MKSIKYEKDVNMLLTNCPYNDPDSIDQVKVGSIACEYCEGYLEHDEENHIVKCEFDDIIQERENG